MMRKNLNQEFDSIFKDTDKNISSIKRQLGDQGRTRIPPRSPVNANSTASLLNHTMSNFGQLKTPVSNASSNNSPTTLVTSLFRRLEEQSKTIEVLEKMVQNQNNEIVKIKMMQKEMKSSVDQNNGLDLRDRIENVERELHNEIESMRNLIKNQSHGHGDKYLSQDLKSQRRFVENEIDSLRGELDNLKSRVGKIEYNVGVSLRDTTELNRKYSHIEGDVENIVTNQRSLKTATDGGERQLQIIKNELEEIGSLMRRLRNEDKQEINNNKQEINNNEVNSGLAKTKSKPPHSSERTVRKGGSPSLSFLSNISDDLSWNSLDFSDVEVVSSVSKELSNDLKHFSSVDDEMLQFDSDIDKSPILKETSGKKKVNSRRHISFISDDNMDDDDLRFDSDIDKSLLSKEFIARDTRHTSILDDDDGDDEILGFDSAKEDDELFLGNSISSLDKLKLSDVDKEHSSHGHISDASL